MAPTFIEIQLMSGSEEESVKIVQKHRYIPNIVYLYYT